MRADLERGSPCGCLPPGLSVPPEFQERPHEPRRKQLTENQSKPCPFCQGSGRCSRCGGEGLRLAHRGLLRWARKTPCRACEGKGKCQLCHGKGHLAGRS